MDFEQLFKYYYRPLCLYAIHYLKQVDDVEDIVQDCFMRLLERPQANNPKAYLYTAVRNACISKLRRDDSRRFSIITPEDTEGPISDEEAQERSLHEAELWTAIDTLPPRCREVFLLAKREGMTYREIALRLGISEKTVEHQVSKALRTLRGKADDYFYSLLFSVA